MNIIPVKIRNWWRHVFVNIFLKSLKLNNTWARFFWTLTAITILDGVSIIFEFTKYKVESGAFFKTPFEIHVLYLTTLSLYVISKFAVMYWKLRSGITISKPGEIVAMTWIYLASIIIFISLIKDVTFATPQYIYWMLGYNIMLTFGSKHLQQKIASKFGVTDSKNNEKVL